MRGKERVRLHVRSFANCRLSGSSAFARAHRPRSCPASAAAGTRGRNASFGARSLRPNSQVITWLGSVPSTDLFLSVITLGEIRKGIENKRRQAFMMLPASKRGSLRSRCATARASFPSMSKASTNGEGSWRVIRRCRSRTANSSRLHCSTISPSQRAMLGTSCRPGSPSSARSDYGCAFLSSSATRACNCALPGSRVSSSRAWRSATVNSP